MAKEGESKTRIEERMKETKLEFILDDVDILLKENQEGLFRIADIVKNLKSFAYVESDSAYTEADLNEGVRSALLIARNELKYHSDVKLDLGNIPPVACRIGEINQVILNLLVNAGQAIKSQARKERGLITVRTYDNNGFVFCEIKDDGPGISSEVKDRIFEPFFTTKPKGTGTGLGLSISHDIIVSKHHGDLSFVSEPGKGSTFRISLPLRQPKIGSPSV
jgi:signal transduction histidine kinase